jgi:Kef-type K+ transport system membrane component KefB
MEPHIFLLQLVLILFAARIVGEIAAYLGIPSVIGELLAGVLIGPSMLGFVNHSQEIYLLAQIGIILLLFDVGIETDIARLTAAGLKAAVVALVGVILPFLGGFGISYYAFNYSLLISLFVGCTLTATSIGITLRVLRDLKKQNTHESQIILGAAVLDDILGIIMLAILYEFSISGEVHLWNAGKILIFIALFFVIAPIAAKLITLTIEKWDQLSAIPGLLPTMIVSLILLFAWTAHVLGAPELLGGFAAGLALSKHFKFPFSQLNLSDEFSHRVETQMNPIVNLFTPIFFVSIGLSLNLKEIEWGSAWIWILTGSIFLVALIGKLLSGFFLYGENRFVKTIVGTAMVPRGEVGLIFASVGLNTEVFKADVYTSLILVIAFTTLLAPFLLKVLYSKKDKQEVTSS